MKPLKIDDEIMPAVVARDVPGVVALATTAEEFICHEAFGVRCINDNTPMCPDSVFFIASMTKPITTAAAMQLVERGLLQLDEPIAKILPEFSSLNVLEGFNNDGAPKLRPASRPITLRQLLTHTSGYCYDLWNADMVRYMKHTGMRAMTTRERGKATIPLMSDPGTRWEYGIGIDLVGKAIEAVSGKRLEVYLHENLFSPLNMGDTSFKLREDQRQRLVSMHTRTPNNGLELTHFETPQDLEFEMVDPGLYGTAADYGHFIKMILNHGVYNGNRVLLPETIDLICSNNIGSLDICKLRSANPSLTYDVEFYPNQKKKWGLGFMINTERTAEGRNPFSLAWGGLGNTYFWIDPSSCIGGLIMTQVLPFADPRVLQLFGRFERSVYQHLFCN